MNFGVKSDSAKATYEKDPKTSPFGLRNENQRIEE